MINQKPKIALITLKNSYSYGGVFAKLKVVHEFCEQYFQSTVFCLSFDKEISANLKSLRFSSKIRKSNKFGMDYVEVGARWAFWEPGHYAFTKSLWAKLLKDYDYIWVVSGNCTAACVPVQLNKKFAMWIASDYMQDRQHRIKDLSRFRYFLHWLGLTKMLKMEKTILNKADFIWSLSKYTQRRFEQILEDKRDNTAICNYPMQVKVNNPKINLSKTKNIIAVGRFSDPRKNINMLIRAFNKLYKSMPTLKLYVVGSKPSQDIIVNFSVLPCFKNIVFTGQVSDQRLDEFYRLSDLMLISSYQEGLGIIGLQALSYGVPVVATDCGGTKDFIVNGYNGFLVKIDDHKDMANKALKILNSDILAKEFGAFAIEFIKNNFSQKKIYALFKFGLIKTYPELKEIFNENTSDRACIYSTYKQAKMENISKQI